MNQSYYRLATVVATAMLFGSTISVAYGGMSAGVAGSKEVGINEEAKLRVTKAHPSLLTAEGQMSGTYRGKISLRLTISSPVRAVAAFTSYPSGGSISGSATVRYIAEGSISHFSGYGSLSKGTGRYTHAYSRNIYVSGRYDRRHGLITLRISGKIRL